MIENITNTRSTMNAREELQEILKKQKEKGLDLVCAEIQHEVGWGEDHATKIELKLAHTPEEAEAFFDALNFNYNDGYGTQELYGTVWLTYGVWLSRWEYDGSEGWQVNRCPGIPNYLRKTQ